MTQLVGRLSLDLVAADLHSAADVCSWLSECTLRVDGIECAPRELAAVRRVAKAVTAGAIAATRHRHAPPDAIRLLNRAAALPPLMPRLDPESHDFEWFRPTVGAAMSEVARDALAMFADPDQRARIRRCANSGCERLFFDDSRPGNRRWCSPDRCGDQARARAYRARKK